MNEFRVEYTTDEEIGSDYNGYPEYRTTVDKLTASTLSELYEKMAQVVVGNKQYTGRDIEFDDTIEEVNVISINPFDNNVLVNTNTYQEYNNQFMEKEKQEKDHNKAKQIIIEQQQEDNERIVYEILKARFEPTIQPIEEAAQVSPESFDKFVQTIENFADRMRPFDPIFQKVIDDKFWESLQQTNKEN
jgi:hypothetical protein